MLPALGRERLGDLTLPKLQRYSGLRAGGVIHVRCGCSRIDRDPRPDSHT
jgi:hypothetical protein